MKELTKMALILGMCHEMAAKESSQPSRKWSRAQHFVPLLVDTILLPNYIIALTMFSHLLTENYFTFQLIVIIFQIAKHHDLRGMKLTLFIFYSRMMLRVRTVLFLKYIYIYATYIFFLLYIDIDDYCRSNFFQFTAKKKKERNRELR